MKINAQHIFLTGFMASGKTTIGRTLAVHLRASFVDLDELIAKRTGRTVPAIINEDGEGYFRLLETRALRAALAAYDRRTLILAAGGGAWMIEANRVLLATRNCITVWLDAPFELCWQRITTDSPSLARPLAPNEQLARRLYEQRRGIYRFATHRIEINARLSAEDAALMIADKLDLHYEQSQEGMNDGR